MLLRRIDRLESGMHIRFQNWDDAAPMNYGIVDVTLNVGPADRCAVRFYRGDEEMISGHKFFPDDLVEVII